MKSVVLWTVASVLLAAAGATKTEQHAIDTHRSVMTVKVSAFGHDHEIAAPISGGDVDAAAHRVELHVDSKALRVRDPHGLDKDRGEIESTMLGPEVLDAERYPEIVFRTSSVEPAGPGSWNVWGQTGGLQANGIWHQADPSWWRRGTSKG